ncbi:endopeptidase La [Pusillimonas sp. (ex Stolz et al. 2005)]|uniref:endopeptidase La n=1 Tax=Pusillimonas sp. (ex Stolz et al. 2005) TaxID=1979962 RepID=UPI00260611D4|nr:endopeptidase La [Pusillimonas sp. (ex Stolz et al. 2005)]
MDTKTNDPISTDHAQDSQAAAADQTELNIPDDALIIIPVRNLVVFPQMVAPIGIGRESSIKAAQNAARSGRQVGIVLQRDADNNEPMGVDLHRVGTLASILRYVTTPDGQHHLICQGEQRFVIKEYLPDYPFLVARVETYEEPETTDPEIEARMLQLKTRTADILRMLPQAPPELANTAAGITSPAVLADFVSGLMDIKPAEKQDILETFDLLPRLDKVLGFLVHFAEVLRISQDIDKQTKERFEDRQREVLLREQLKTIQQELGETESNAAEIAEIEANIEKAQMPEEVEKIARKELRRLSNMPDASAEYSSLRTYLDWLTELPWNITTDERIDISEARETLDADHFGLEKIKRRILEYLAVRKLNPEGRSPILCFVGPPGVGKTSLGQSIAKATGRKFARLGLGGVHDEAEIRGHRRTYIGALPGNIIQAIHKAGSRNCVLMLDEVDKLGGGGVHGDPAAALLEVLDPEQNSAFRDNYLAVPFDLSKVMFITTANVLDAIPGPLRDRMEVIQLLGYTESEKMEIARRYLVQRQLEANGLTSEQCELTDAALRAIIHFYTREAGVRNLEREIGSVFRHAAMRIAEGTDKRVTVDEGDLHSILGARKYESELAMRTSLAGVATGLAWTPVGGDILFIEASRAPGNGRLILTGQLGDVMKESAQAALTLLKGKAKSLGIEPESFEKQDIHVHVPAGAIPKDGPSAGTAMFVALASLMTERPVRYDLAMTGEISLRGLVLPVGGIKEKVLAALQAGIRTVLLPARNEKDLEDIPEEARQQLQFVFLENVEQALAVALEEAAASVS